MKIYCVFLLVCTVLKLTLKAVLNELHPVRSSWYNIGLELDIPHTELDNLKEDHSGSSHLMREMLKYWIDKAVVPPTWETVVKALRSGIVDEKFVAKQLESKYCTPVCHVMKESMENSEGMACHFYQ